MSETATENKGLQDVQDRLMKMLDSVCLDPNAVPKDRPAPRKKPDDSDSAQKQNSANSSRVNVCPSCRSEEPWGSSSWCPACGYYPQLKRKVFDATLAEVAEEGEDDEEDLGLTTMATMVPRWIYWLSGGIVFLLIESLAIRSLVPRLSQRSPIAILQILTGLNVLGIAHLRAYFVAAHEDENLNIISIFWSPMVIWKTVITQMPRVRRTVYAGAWGLASVLFAVIFIGVDYLSVITTMNAAPRRAANPMKTILAVTNTMASASPTPHGGGTDDLEGALVDFAGDAAFETTQQAGDATEDLLEDAADGNEGDKTEADKDDEEEIKLDIVWSSVPVNGPKEYDSEYLVIGFLTNASGQLRSLLLAETIETSGAVRFAGKYSITLRDKKFINKLQLQLEAYLSRYPAMQTPYIANWTAPYVTVKIVHNGISPDGRFVDGQILFYQNKPPR